MSIASLNYIAFLLLLIIVYKICPKKIKWVVLLLASYSFYFLNSSKLIIFILISTLSIYLDALWMNKVEKNSKEKLKTIEDKETKKEIKKKTKKKKKWILALGIIINIGILWTLKYSGFFAQIINVLPHVNLPIKHFTLPLGISYYTLAAISYIVDVYRGKIKADKNIGRVALFLAYFPQLVQGPIGRYDKLAHQLYDGNTVTLDTIKYGSQLMIWGFFKKLVVADRVGIFVANIFKDYNKNSGIVLLFAIIGYTLQLYAEFSGGIDIVRGTSQMFGIELEENFKRPFFSKSVDEFWRRWNITLGTWLKEYIFYPVSLSPISMKITNFTGKHLKKSYYSKLIPAILPLLCVWLGNGIWHGSGSKYIIYGLYYFTIMMIGKIFKPLTDKILEKLKVDTNLFSYRFLQIVRTNILVVLGMLIFRAKDLAEVGKIIRLMFTSNNFGQVLDFSIFTKCGLIPADYVILAFGVLLMLYISVKQEKGYKIRETINRQVLLFRWPISILAIVFIVVFGVYGPGYNVANFIYGGF